MDEYIAIIKMFAGNFAPRGWMFCNGQILPINQYTALFSLLGTTYGGNGQTTFALPDLRGRFPLGTGSGPGLTPRTLGEMAGTETVTLNTNEIPSHSHVIPALTLSGQAKVRVSDAVADAFAAKNNALAQATQKFTPTSPDGDRPKIYQTNATFAENNYLNASSLDTSGLTTNSANSALAGGNLPHNNMPPYLALNFIICVEGIYPPRD